MTLVSYFNPTTLDRDNNGQLGLVINLIDKGWQFFPIGSKEFEVCLNHVDEIKSFTLQIDIGSCTFSKQFRKSGDRTEGYWYASKRKKGKLERVYFGKKVFTTENLQAILEKFNEEIEQPGTVVQERNCTTVPGCLELAGHGKSEKHLQPNLIPVNEEIAMLRADVESLKGYINQQANQNIILGEELRALQRDRLKIIKEKDAIAKDLLVYSTQHRNHSLGVLVAQERMKELEQTVETSKEMLQILRDEAKNAVERIYELEAKLNEKDLDIDACLIVYEGLEDKFAGYRMAIEKYRQLATGKVKQKHPRYSYLIDFLAEIDNLSL